MVKPIDIDCCEAKPKVVKRKVSIGYAECSTCGHKGPTVQAETHEQVDEASVEAFRKVQTHLKSAEDVGH